MQVRWASPDSNVVRILIGLKKAFCEPSFGEGFGSQKQSNPRLIMNKKKHNEEIIGKSLLQGVCEKRKEEERRRQPSNGYARISIVGWICRRERLRRMRDSGRSNDNEI
jgi:hypothetical protein